MTEQPGDPDDLLSVIFDDAGPVDEMVAIGPIPFTSLCEHHLLPFTGHAWVAYIPTGGVIGLSKVPRLVEHYARTIQVQERLTADIADAITKRVPSLGVAVTMTATHTCATMRGIRREAPMTTTRLVGVFRDDPTVRGEYLSWVKG
jgi:GTP cyclohydrolase I